MPEVHVHIRWPDDRAEVCYSPSTAIKTVFAAGQTYALADFMARAEDGLTQAGERVRAVYGYACSSAADQLQRLRETAATYAEHSDASVTIERIDG
jgi:uncharacterized repeat protein (TIGR04042 family)